MVPWSGVLNGAVLLAAGCLLSRTTTAAPLGLRFDNSTIWHGSLEVRDTDHGPSFSFPGVDLRVEPRAANSFTLRILPLGASITEGYKSSDGTGYREALRAQLRHAGWSVNMVESVASGAMSDKSHEGHPAYKIEQVMQEATRSVGYKPNVVLINEGTNDATQQYFVGR